MIYVFDADGVVIRPWGFATALRQEHGIAPEQTRAFFQGPFQDCLTGRADLIETLTPFVDVWGWTGTVNELIDYWLLKDDLPDTPVQQ